MHMVTSRLEPCSFPASALSSVLFPHPGGPRSSVKRPGRMVPLTPFRMDMRCLVGLSNLSALSMLCRQRKQQSALVA